MQAFIDGSKVFNYSNNSNSLQEMVHLHLHPHHILTTAKSVTIIVSHSYSCTMTPAPVSDIHNAFAIENGASLDERSAVFSKKGTDLKSMAVGAQKNGRSLVPTIPQFKTKEEEQRYCKQHLAAAFRVFADRGYDEGVAGHMSLRDPIRSDHFWINPYVLTSVDFNISSPPSLRIKLTVANIMQLCHALCGYQGLRPCVSQRGSGDHRGGPRCERCRLFHPQRDPQSSPLDQCCLSRTRMFTCLDANFRISTDIVLRLFMARLILSLARNFLP